MKLLLRKVMEDRKNAVEKDTLAFSLFEILDKLKNWRVLIIGK